MDDQIYVTLQMGVQKQHLNLDRNAQMDLYQSLRDKARQFVEQHCPNQKLSSDRILLFRHNYDSINLLQLLQNDEGINNGTVIEIVISNKNERPAYPHVLNQLQNYYAPTFCDYCGEILVGLVRQGLKCSKCNLNFHKKCAFASHNNCSSHSRGQQPEAEWANYNFSLPHTFVVHTYKKPTVCKVCNNMLLGIVKQGLQCRDCKVNVHKKCAACLPFDCRPTEGMNAGGSTTPDSMDVDLIGSGSESSSSFSGSLSLSTATVTSADSTKNGLEEKLSTGDMIQLARIPGQASVRTSRPRTAPVLMEGWLLHFTNQNPTRRRHYWLMDTAGITLFHNDQTQNTSRYYKAIPLSTILGVRPYEGAPLDPSGPPHCFEIQTAQIIYFVGENLDWYSKTGGGPPQLPRRESGVGLASAQKWLNAISKALLPPQVPNDHRTSSAGAQSGPENPEEAQQAQQIAFEFSQLYQFNQQEELGCGQFGTVYGGVHRSTGRRVAVKVILKSRFGRKQKEQLRTEVAILQNISYPGIITLEAMFETRDRIFVVMEKMEADMLEMILSNRLGRLSERITKFLILQILKALKYLHYQDIAHCDLKPENVLLNLAETDYPQTKLCDFGYARIIGENTFRKTVVGTPAYLAPEVLQKKGYNKSLDMWSVGVIIYVTLSGTFPFNEGEDIADQITNAAFMYPPNPWAEISKDAIDMINKLLKVNMEERPIIDECLTHGWLQDPQLYADLRRLEERLGIRYLTNEDDDRLWASKAVGL